MPAEPAIAVTNLVKSYDRRRVVDNVTLTVPAGAVCALLGPNGAGKTTTVECVEGFREPDEGQVRVLGLDPLTQRGELMPRLGVMLQEGGAYQAATPWEMLRLYTRFYPDPRDPADLLERVGLTDVAGRYYRSLSGGQKQRLNLALALVGRPEVVLLDEPTAGMDPQARQSAWEEIRSLRAAGDTVLLTTHFMDEAERLADLVAVIDQGRMLAFDSPAALVARHADQQVLVTTPARIDIIDLSAAVRARVRPDGEGRYVVDAGADRIPPISAWFAEEGLPVTGISAGGGGLEAVFLRLTGRKVRP
ncbi:MAG: ATP-binding cassette domain-containing protein [Nitriliruptorales bacterium]|nr:ATP-binding cassette domain-containing protein [Nitriliruptorales bacterium]